MSNIRNIGRRVFSLLAANPEGAGLTVSLGGGGTDIICPNFGDSPLAGMIFASGKIKVREPEIRPLYNLRVYLEDRGGKYQGSLSRITGMAMLPSIPDDEEYLASIEGATLAEAEESFCRALEEKVPDGIELTARTIVYRHNQFAHSQFAPDRGKPRSGWLDIFAAVLSGAQSDTTLESFVDGAVSKALDWSPEGRKPTSISLWFTVNGECLKTIYTTINVLEAGYSIEACDRSCWPWNEKAIARRVATKEAVRQAIVGYIGGRYAFTLSELQVYFAWSEAL